MAALVRRDPFERRRSVRVLLDPGQRVVQQDRVSFEAEVLEALGGLGGYRGHRRHATRR
jgi:hypothetical protein